MYWSGSAGSGAQSWDMENNKLANNNGPKVLINPRALGLVLIAWPNKATARSRSGAETGGSGVVMGVVLIRCGLLYRGPVVGRLV